MGFSLCSSRVLFERLNWLPLKDEISLFKRKLIFRRIRQADCPSYITELLPRNSDSNSRVSRYADYVPGTTEKRKEVGPFKLMGQSSGMEFLQSYVKRTPSVPLVRSRRST